MRQKVSLLTFGCKLNQAETQAIAERLSKDFEINFEEKNGESDIYILNTCAVTKEAERKVRQTIRRLKNLNKDSKIVTIGCFSNANPKELENLGVDLVLGNFEKKNIENFIEKNGVYVDKNFWLNKEKIVIMKPQSAYSNYTRFFLPIEEGCINGCTFCKIRFLRGIKISSLSQEEVITQIREAIKRGYKEVVLTGINLGYYGFERGESLEDLLNNVGKIFDNKDIRIRLTSLYPENVSNNLSFILNNYSIFEKHVHLSIQHFSDKILKAMGRKYSSKDVSTAINLLRKYDPKFSITCDLIVGFPGEEAEDFQIMLDSIKNLKLLKVHGFRFSPREGTIAAKMENQIPENEKKERLNRLLSVSEKSKYDYLSQLINSEVNVLIESFYKNNFYGYDEYYIFHEITNTSDNLKKGEFVRSKIFSISNRRKGVASNVF